MNAANGTNSEIKISSHNVSDTKILITVNGQIVGTVDFECSQTVPNMTSVVLAFQNIEYETGDGQYQVVSSMVPRGTAYVSLSELDVRSIGAHIPDAVNLESPRISPVIANRNIRSTNR